MNLPLIGSPLPASIIVLTYFLLVFKIGPDFMECRKPYNVRSAMLKYNIAQIAMNLLIFVAVSPNILSNFYIFIISLFQAYYYIFVKKLYDFRCMEKLPLDHPNKNMERWLVYLYFLNKVLDLADTLFFVLRKSYKQITVLHVYHHALMVVGVAGTYYFYGPGGQYSMTGIINSLVHVFMYGYYFAAAPPAGGQEPTLAKEIRYPAAVPAVYDPFPPGAADLVAESRLRVPQAVAVPPDAGLHLHDGHVWQLLLSNLCQSQEQNELRNKVSVLAEFCF